MRQKASELFIQGDEKHQRTVAIIEGLLEGKEPLALAQKYKVSRQAVTSIRAKYINTAICDAQIVKTA